MSGTARVITFLGASGGVGTSCLLSAVACRAATMGYRVACVDGDAGGGGLDVVFGMDHLSGVRWPEVLGAHGDLSAELLMQEMPQENGIWVLSHARDAVTTVPDEAVRTVMRALVRGADLVLVDGGRARPAARGRQRGVGPVGSAREPASAGVLDSSAWSDADDVVLVVGAGPQSLAAATAITGALPELGPRWWLAQRTPRSAEHLPETVQAALGVALVVAVGDDNRCDHALINGVPPGRRGSLAKTADRLLSAVSETGRRVA